MGQVQILAQMSVILGFYCFFVLYVMFGFDLMVYLVNSDLRSNGDYAAMSHFTFSNLELFLW